MEQIFYSGPSFWAVAQNVPKMAQNTKIVTHPTVFELGSSSLKLHLHAQEFTRILEEITLFQVF